MPVRQYKAGTSKQDEMRRGYFDDFTDLKETGGRMFSCRGGPRARIDCAGLSSLRGVLGPRYSEFHITSQYLPVLAQDLDTLQQPLAYH